MPELFNQYSTCAFAMLLLFISSCGTHPEQQLTGTWKETEAQYEKYKNLDPDNFDPDEYDHRRVVRHETEHWTFNSDKTFIIQKHQGEPHSGRWLLSGRGHILKLYYDDDTPDEVYDIKELNSEKLIINVDIDMEIRGIARLTFQRKPSLTPPAELSAQSSK